VKLEEMFTPIIFQLVKRCFGNEKIEEDKTGEELRTSVFVVSCTITVHYIFSLSRWKSGGSEVEAL